MKKKILIGFALSITTLGSMTFANDPSLTNINTNNGDILTKNIINDLQGNIKNVYNWIKGGFTTNGDITLHKRGSNVNLNLDSDRSGYIRARDLRLASKGSIHLFLDSDNNQSNSLFTVNTNNSSFNSPIKRLLTLDENGDLDLTRTLHLNDFGGRGSKNLIIGDDTYLSDVDIANTLGLYGMQNHDRAGLRFGSDGGLLFSDNGKFGINKTDPKETLDVNGGIVGHDHIYAQTNDNNHYGWLGVYRGDGRRGAYIGRGNGSSSIDFNLDNATNLNFDGGGDINFYDNPIMHKTIQIRDTKGAINLRYDSARLYIGLRHLGRDNNPIEIRTEDANDDGIILTSDGHDVANFKKASTVIDSHDISLKATGTNKGLRIKSDGSVCIGACW